MSSSTRILLAGFVLICCAITTNAEADWDQECVDLVESQQCIPAIGGITRVCCSADGSCETIDSAACLWDGGVPGAPLECSGDSDGNGIDDACECDDFSTTCCLPDGTCSQILPDVCEAMGGRARGWCGSDCSSDCPDPVCLTAEGDCAATHAAPGCDDFSMCGCVCSLLPHCCEEGPDVPATSFRSAFLGAVLLLVAATIYLFARR